MAAQRLDELIAKPLGSEIEHLRIRIAALHFPGDRVQQMCLTKTDRRMNVERIKRRARRQHRFSNLRGARMGQAIGRADDKRIECVTWIER